jgi:prepilin-type N-terminal cleavage/methylation domain-containing protein/prepilin-type processing-associated H-X9-DG protein
MRRGFTLIELLVVIAIIAILAAILFPVFAKARSKAQQNTCLDNVKQMSLAAIAYLTDWDQMTWDYGACQNGWGPTTTDPSLANKLYPYTKNSQIFLCPSTAASPTLASCPPTANGLGDYVACAENMGSSMEKYPYPAEWWWVADMGVANQNQANSPAYGPACATGNNQRVGSCHNNGANVGYMDGHAQWKNMNDPLWNFCANLPASDGTTTSQTALTRHFWLGTD